MEKLNNTSEFEISEEIITKKTYENKTYKMRQFAKLCSNNFIVSCKNCLNTICSNSIINLLYRHVSGKISFLIDISEETEEIQELNSEIIIDDKIITNVLEYGFFYITAKKVSCVNCHHLLGLKIHNVDINQKFLDKKIILLIDNLQFYEEKETGCAPFEFKYRLDTIMSMDQDNKLVNEIETYLRETQQYFNDNILASVSGYKEENFNSDNDENSDSDDSENNEKKIIEKKKKTDVFEKQNEKIKNLEKALNYSIKKNKI